MVRRSAREACWQQATLTAARLAALDQTATYTFDLLDVCLGGWGWFNLDSVSIPGTLVSSPLPQLKISRLGSPGRIAWSASATGYTLHHSTTVSGGYASAGLTVKEEGGENAAYDALGTGARFDQLVK